jgi:hypothetical protein
MRKAILLLLMLSASPAYAQIEHCTGFKEEIDALVAGRVDQNQDHAANLIDPGQNGGCFAIYAAGASQIDKAAFQALVKKFESSRSDKQAGGAAGASGTTTVVSQGPAAKVLAVAAEYGAITQTVNGQVVTITGNLAGLPSALVRHDIFPYCSGDGASDSFCVNGSLLSILRRISFGVSFDASRENQVTAAASAAGAATTQPAAFTFAANRSDVAAVSARIEIWNSRDETSKAFTEKWQEKVGAAMSDSGNDLLARAGEFVRDIRRARGYDAWRTKYTDKIRKARRDRAQIVAALNDALAESVAMTKAADRDFQEHADAALASYGRFFLAQDQFIESLAKANVVAFEYANNRPAGQPSTTSLRLILDMPMSTQSKFVANGGVTLYDDPAAIAATGAGRVRDVQAGVELDQALGKFAVTGPAVLSVAGYYQYQNSPAILNIDPANPVPGVSFVGLPAGAKTVFATEGHIFLGQAKLSIVPPGSSVKIPASVTFSNRTELIDKPSWRAQIGIAYDFDSLFSGLK